MNNVYFDLEYDNNKDIIEIGAIHVCAGQLCNEFHRFVRQEIRPFEYGRCAQNSHCIHPMVLQINGLSEADALNDLKLFFKAIKGPFVLKGNGEDMTKSNLESLFPFLKEYEVTYKQVHLPNWCVRLYEPSHISTLCMKQTTNLLSCHRDFHTMKYRPNWILRAETPNHTKISKFVYGAHCALFDCFELAFYENNLPHYCCDMHFKECFVYNPECISPPTYDACTNPFDALCIKND